MSKGNNGWGRLAEPSGQDSPAQPPTQVSCSRPRETISVSILSQVILLNNRSVALCHSTATVQFRPNVR